MIPGKQEIWQTKCTETREIENAHAVWCETNDVIEIVLKMTKSCFLKSPTHNECCKIRFTYVTKPKTQSELNDTNFLSYWLPIHSKFTLGNSMLKAERKETGKNISLSVVRDSPRKLTAVLEIRICFKFYFFQFLILQHNWVMNQSIGDSSKFTIDKRASIPLEIFFLFKKKRLLKLSWWISFTHQRSYYTRSTYTSVNTRK